MEFWLGLVFGLQFLDDHSQHLCDSRFRYVNFTNWDTDLCCDLVRGSLLDRCHFIYSPSFFKDSFLDDRICLGDQFVFVLPLQHFAELLEGLGVFNGIEEVLDIGVPAADIGSIFSLDVADQIGGNCFEPTAEISLVGIVVKRLNRPQQLHHYFLCYVWRVLFLHTKSSAPMKNYRRILVHEPTPSDLVLIVSQLAQQRNAGCKRFVHQFAILPICTLVLLDLNFFFRLRARNWQNPRNNFNRRIAQRVSAASFLQKQGVRHGNSSFLPAFNSATKRYWH